LPWSAPFHFLDPPAAVVRKFTLYPQIQKLQKWSLFSKSQYRILGVFPLDEIADVGVSVSENLKLISREIIFEVFQPM